jgi:predicted GNAT family acetyltransferase
MRITRVKDVGQFARIVEPYLIEREAEHCLLFGIINTRRGELSLANGRQMYMAFVADETGTVTLVAVQTPPHNIVLSHMADGYDPKEALAIVAADVFAAGYELPGVHAPDTLAWQFAELWRAFTGEAFQVDVHERIYRLTTVTRLPLAPGRMRRITASDRDLLWAWLQDFMKEALGKEDPEIDQQIDRRLLFGTSGMYLWEDGERTCLTGYGGPTPHGIRIGPVYTPPQLRGRR